MIYKLKQTNNKSGKSDSQSRYNVKFEYEMM